MYRTITFPPNYVLLTGAPAEYSPTVLAQYLTLLSEGNAVTVNSALVKEAELLAIIFSPLNNHVIAGAALKKTKANELYYYGIFSHRKANIAEPFSKETYPFDLGYIVTAPEFRNRGLCDAVMYALLELRASSNMLATTQDQSIKNKLQRYGFEHHGSEWTSQHNDGNLSLHLRHGSTLIQDELA